MSPVTVSIQDERYSADSGKLDRIVSTIASALGTPREVSIAFVSAEDIRVLNREYRGKDRATDVLSFPQIAWAVSPSTSQPGGTVSDTKLLQTLGDLVVCPEVAHENAENIGQGLDREICFLIIHGMLHLCGYDHEDPEAEQTMLAEQKSLLALLETGSGDPPLWKNCLTQMR